MPTQDSSTGGYLSPGISADLEGQALEDFLQTVVVGIVGLPGAMVRPRWQEDAPDAPPMETNWAAIGVNRRRNEPFAYVEHSPGYSGVNPNDRVERPQELEVLVSFYGPASDMNAQQWTEGLQVALNREAMQQNGFALIETEDPIAAHEQMQDGRWRRRIDVNSRFRRTLTRTYPILNVESAQGVLHTLDKTVVDTDISVADD